jgi:arylsulfatase A-like enzyme
VGKLEGLRQGDWKLLVKQASSRRNQQGEKKLPQMMLFDLKNDLGEQNNLAGQYPEIVQKLRKRMEILDQEITINARAPWIKN